MLTLTKGYRDVVEGLQKFVKDGVVTEGDDQGTKMLTLDGTFEIFDPHDLDMWGGQMRFVVRDTAVDENDDAMVAWRGRLAMQAPQLAGLMTAKATMTIQKLCTVKTVTRTIVDNGRPQETVTETEEWRDVTAEFHKRTTRIVAGREW